MTHESWMPHGFCFAWDPGVLWLRVASDAVIALAYYSIPLSLLRLRTRMPGLLAPPLLVMFSTFIFACGTTHVFDIITVWYPIYVADAWVRLFTALVSIGTAVGISFGLPALIKILLMLAKP